MHTYIHLPRSRASRPTSMYRSPSTSGAPARSPTALFGPPSLCTLLLLLVLLLLLTLTSNGYCAAHLSSASFETNKHWKLLAYNFPAHAPVRDINFYNPLQVIATGIAVSDDRVFIATPQLFSGVPSSMNFVWKRDFHKSPVLQAYPDWSFPTTKRKDVNCSDQVIVSAYRMRIDSCNRLWVLDSGVSRSFEDAEQTCPPKILIIDLRTNAVVQRVDLPSTILRRNSLLTNIIIDETTSTSRYCADVFAYIADTVEPITPRWQSIPIVVYDSKQDLMWRVSHPSMYPDANFAETRILNDTFRLMDGIIGLAFDDRNGILYFQPLATDNIYSVSRQSLRAGPRDDKQSLDVNLIFKKTSQAMAMVYSPVDGSILFSPMTETAITSWNPISLKFLTLAYDPVRLQFVADLVTTFAEDGIFYALSSKFQRFFLRTVNPFEYNLHILRGRLPGTVPHNLTNGRRVRNRSALGVYARSAENSIKPCREHFSTSHIHQYDCSTTTNTNTNNNTNNNTSTNTTQHRTPTADGTA